MAVELTTQTLEQTRARNPDETGYVERDGVKVYYEVYGKGEPTVLLLPTWSLIHSRHWKMQIPYLARHCRLVTFDVNTGPVSPLRVSNRPPGRSGASGIYDTNARAGAYLGMSVGSSGWP